MTQSVLDPQPRTNTEPEASDIGAILQVRQIFMEEGLALLAVVVDKEGQIVFFSNGSGSKSMAAQALDELVKQLSTKPLTIEATVAEAI